MSEYFSTMQKLRHPVPGLFARSTIMGGALSDLPSLPLTSRDVTLPPALPTPAIIRPRDIDLSPRQVAECRRLTVHLHRERSGLHGWDRTFLRELARWRRPPTPWEAEQVAALAERAFWAARDGAEPC